MKKNKAMRAAGGMFVVTMLTTSIISGTYAKYVTEGSGTDSARVAMFGVEVKASGSLFSDTYYSVEDGNTSTAGTKSVITVDSFDNAKVVAPGTKNNDGFGFSITGKPEVAVEVSFSVDTDSVKDIFLEAGTYTDMTTSEKRDRFTFTDDYYPIVYTLVTPKTNGTGETDITTGTLSEIAAKLNGLKLTYDPNTDLSDVLDDVKLTWEWKFEGPTTVGSTVFDKDTVDKADTLLGDLAARKYGSFTFADDEINIPGAESYNLDTEIEIAVTVTQID